MLLDQIRKLSAAAVGPVTVLTGEEVGLFQLAKAELLERVGYDSQDLGYSLFDAAEVPYEQIDMDLQSLPFFADEKVVIMDNTLDITTAKKRYWSDEELKRFEAYLEAPNETVKLLLIAPGKLDSKRRLVKLLKRDALILEASPLKEQELRDYVRQNAGQKGLSIAPQVLEQLLQKSNFDVSETLRNLSFLASYKADKVILAEDIATAIPKTLQDNVFDLSQFLLTGRIDQARSLVQDLRLQGEEEIKLIAILLSQLRLYLQVQLLARDGLSEQQIVSELSTILGRKLNPYQIKYALRDSRRLSPKQLGRMVSTLIEADFTIKQGKLDKTDAFDLALLQLLPR